MPDTSEFHPDTGSPHDGAAGQGGRLARSAWIESPAFDLFLLILAPLTLLPLVLGYYFMPGVVVRIYVVLAFAHYASSFVFYFWDENQAYQRGRWLAFFGGPVIIACVYLTLMAFEMPYLVFTVVLFWNTWHVARQNCGILSLYRSGAKVPDAGFEQKTSANNAIVAVSTLLMLSNIDTNPEAVELFARVSPQLLDIIQLLAIVAALYCCARLGLVLVRRPSAVGVPEALFIVASLVFFYPYLLAANSAVATSLMLLPHFVQYMALVWLLHRRKFGNAADGLPRLLRRASASTPLLIFGLLAVGGAFYLLQFVATRTGHRDLITDLVLIIALTHFYIDGLNWSFRRAHVRQTMLPFLLPQQPRQV